MRPGIKNMIELSLWFGFTVGYWALLYASPIYYPTMSPAVVGGIIWTVYAIHRIKQCWAKV
jgi:hypothetical protein